MLAIWSGSLRINVLLWLVSLVCLVGLGEVLAREFYGEVKHPNSAQTGSYFPKDNYRWRPLNGEEQGLYIAPPSESIKQHQYRQPGYPSSAIDYADTPPGLPRGVYRPVEERHTITPHKDGYRFRTLTPSEQQRIKRRNEAYSQSIQPLSQEKRTTLSTDNYGLTKPQRQEIYKFRPDKRLDKKSTPGSWGRTGEFPYNPAFTEAYPAPMFRPD
jgi:hypothetical protein